MKGTSQTDCRSGQLIEVLQQFWGYDSFLPLQQEAMHCVLQGHDSIVVLPTGGGKSLCFQAPALCREGLALVVSPLISLMKDQVDALRSCGVPAAYVNSSLTFAERRDVAADVRSGTVRLLYIAPERLMAERTLAFLDTLDLSLVAIDEAHCISAWGHDFRPEYRALKVLRERFPQVAIHAYTATATPRVRNDIGEQLQLRDASMLVGSFDRPNLIYRVQWRNNGLRQIQEVLDRHEGESGIVYCITRKDVEATTAALVEAGYRAVPYHAGMDDQSRRRNQDAFMDERAETVVATVAFGMGIDKPNVRYVVHAGMPKSLENYQQESGRAGRDGLEAECCLFFSGQDFHTWKRITEDSEPSARAAGLATLSDMWDFCNSVVCRHRSLVEHFGQQLDAASCKACDVCLGDLDLVDDPLTVGQKILSCVVRLGQQYGGDYTAKVLSGSNDAQIVQRGHDQLSTWGILGDESKRAIRDWIEQLVGQHYLAKVGEYNVVQVTDDGRRLLRGESTPRLLRPVKRTREKRRAAPFLDSWDGVDRGLFEELRKLRYEEATARGLPPYMIFDDAAIRDMARRRPSSAAGLHLVRGVGEKKLADFGEQFLEQITAYCSERALATDLAPSNPTPAVRGAAATNVTRRAAFEAFRQGASVDEVAGRLDRSPATVVSYLEEFLQREGITDPSPWVDEETAERIRSAVADVGSERLKPIFERLEGQIDYAQIRAVVTCVQNQS